MPRDVIMPALGMAQDTGLIVAWHKEAGDAVKAGDVLFEVETDKATMEVEADIAGFLGDVRAGAGEAVPVGQVIATIAETAQEAQSAQGAANSESASEVAPAEAAAQQAAATLPEGEKVIMPVLGMAQDSGILVNWLKSAGEQVEKDDPLFEVETDKSTMEVAAGASGFVAAILAEAGEDIPTGETIAIISAEKPVSPITRAFFGGDAPAQAEPAKAAPPVEKAVEKPKSKPVPKPATATKIKRQGRILASPKARRLALEKGIDLEDLRAQGYPEPIHAQDIAAFTPNAGTGRNVLNISVNASRFYAFFERHSKGSAEANLDHLLGAFAGRAAAEDEIAIVLEGETILFANGSFAPADADRSADLEIIRNNGESHSRAPTLSLMPRGQMLDIYLSYQAHQLLDEDARNLLTNFAGALEEPLRYLL